MLNGGVTKAIALTISLRRGCSLSPLLFAIATHLIWVKMYELATCGEIIGLALPLGKQLIAQALADDSFSIYSTKRERRVHTKLSIK